MPKELTEIYIPQSSWLITSELQFVRQLKGSKVGGGGVGQTQDCDSDLIDYAANFSYLYKPLFVFMAGESCAARDQDFRIPAKTKAP